MQARRVNVQTEGDGVQQLQGRAASKKGKAESNRKGLHLYLYPNRRILIRLIDRHRFLIKPFFYLFEIFN